MTSTRRDILRSGGLLALGSLFGCASTPVRTSQAPAPFSHPEFAGILGVARADITPPVGIYARNWGAAKHDAAEAIHRPLTLTCATFQTSDDSRLQALIAADLGWWKHLWDERFVREQILKACALDESQL